MKTYNEFLDYVKENIISFLPDEYSGGKAVILKVNKDNGIVLDGLAVRRGEKSSSPTVYLEQYYSALIDGKDEKKIMKKIASDFMDAAEYYAHLAEFDPSDWEFVRNKICYYLVNRELNEGRIKGKMFKPVGDFAKLYMIVSDFETYGYNYMLIPDDLFSQWEISEEELDEAADRNMTVRFPAALLSMDKRMKEGSTGIKAPNLLRKGRNPGDELMYVLTNRRRLHGASAVLYPGILEKIRNFLKNDFYILPYSTEDIVIIPKKSDIRSSFIEALLKETNAKRGNDFFLSDTLYEYSLESGMMSCVSQQN